MATYTITNSFSADTTAIASEVNTNFSDALTALNAFDASNLASGTVPLTRISGLTTTQFAAATLVIESEGIGSNDNDTTIPTSAAVKDYVDTQDTAQFASGGDIESTFGSWTNLDSIGGTLVKTEIYKVGSDGFITGYAVSGSASLDVFIEAGDATPDVKRFGARGYAISNTAGFSCPVGKDEYWQITTSAGAAIIFWKPIGTGTCVKQ